MKNMDVLDLLPSDPFGMDRSATRFRKIWNGEIDSELGSSSFGFGKDGKIEGKKRWDEGSSSFGLGKEGKTERKNRWDDRASRGRNLALKRSMRIYPELGHNSSKRNEVGSSTSIYSVDGKIDEEVENSKTDCLDDGKGAPPRDGWFFALLRLGVKDLLSVQCVCKSLRDTVRNDPLLWQNIHIDQSLSMINDDLLFQLTSRAKGELKCLSIVRNPNITDSGIERVLRSNPKLTKLGVPECKVSVDGLISKLKALKSAGLLVIRQLRVAGLFNITQKQFEDMKSLLPLDNESTQPISAQKPRFYGYGQSHFSFDDDRPIDIDTCPRCLLARPVYDCPGESCQSKKISTCRGCTHCISRCTICGCCISERAYTETFFKDNVCLDCLIMRGINLYISG